MSGSSGGHSSFSKNNMSILTDNSHKISNGGGSGGENSSCVSIDETTYLTSPKSHLKALNKGDTLEVEVFDKGGVKVLGAYDKGGNLIGGIPSIQSDRLIQCIEDGYVYTAEILDINVAKIQVRITYKI